MTFREKQNNLYDGVLRGDILTTKNLKSYGFKSKDLTKLARARDILIREKIGFYKFVDIVHFYQYGLEQNYDKRKECMKKCLELDPTFKEAILQLFGMMIKEQKYDEAFNYLETLYGFDNLEDHKDYNLYLVLLSRLTGVPESLQDRLLKIELEDVFITKSSDKYNNVGYENGIRYKLYEGEYKWARSLMGVHSAVKEAHDLFFLLTKRIISKDRGDVNKHLSFEVLVQNRKFDDIKKILESRKQLSNKRRILLQLVTIYLEVKRTRIVPRYQEYSGNNVREAILCNDFEKAFKLLEMQDDKSANFLMIKEMIDLMQEINGEKKATLTDIYNDLMNNTLDKAYQDIHTFLGDIQALAYESFIISLVKISLIDGDTFFTRPISILYFLSKNVYSLDINSYVRDFKEVVREGRFREAELYLELIERANATFSFNINIQELQLYLQENKVILQSEYRDSLFDAVYDNVMETQDLVVLDNITANDKARFYEGAYKKMNFKAYASGNKMAFKYYNRRFDIGVLAKEVKKAFDEGDYPLCVELGLEVLSNVSVPRAYTCALLGKAYLKMGEIQEAIKYFLMVNMLDKYFDYTIIIDMLKSVEGKSVISFDDFRREDYSSIPNIDDILMQILGNNESIMAVANLYGLNLDQINLVRLIVAREYFKLGDKIWAKALLKDVRTSGFISETVALVFSELFLYGAVSQPQKNGISRNTRKKEN